MSRAARLSRPLANLGRAVIDTVAGLGRIAMFTGQVASHIVRPPFYGRELLTQIIAIGWLSLPVVALTALFTGGALALQIYSGGARFQAEFAVPSIVAIGMVRELGPVLGGLMVAARVASSIAAEIGTMKVTEQIDALVTLSTNPLKYLVVPRVVAATLSMPVLVAVGDIIGIMGGWLVGTTRLDFNSGSYIYNTWTYLEFWDVGSGLVKGAAFGAIVALMGCYHGIMSGRGAQGVGQATKSAVVAASILILAANYALTELFFTS